MVLYVMLIFGIGIYFASAVLIGYFMLRHGRYRYAITLPVAIGVPLFFYVVFERWFLVMLPKGPIETLLGL
jgi:predicted MFS family arabinose efflux permease